MTIHSDLLQLKQLNSMEILLYFIFKTIKCDWSTFHLASRVDRSHLIVLKMKWIKISMLFKCFSCSKSLCIVICGTLIWNPGWNATRTVVYNLGIDNGHLGSRSSSTPELKCLVTKLFSMNTNFSSLVMRSKMDYWQSFRIKISHCDTYTRNHYMWRHLLCISHTQLVAMSSQTTQPDLYSYNKM